MARQPANSLHIPGRRGRFSAGPTRALTVRLPVETADRVHAWARERGVSATQVILDLLESYLPPKPDK